MKELRTLPASGPLPRERYGLFLTLRRGLPLLVSTLAFLAAAIHLEGRGWWMLAGVAGLAAAWPTFLRGESYRRKRAAIMRWDGLWARAILPLARRFGQADAWILSFCAWHTIEPVKPSSSRRPDGLWSSSPIASSWPSARRGSLMISKPATTAESAPSEIT